MKSSAQKLLIIGTVWPEPNSSAAGSRMMQLIQLFLNANWDLVFVSTASQGEWSVNLTSLGIETVSVEVNDASFDTFLENCQPNAVLFDRFMTEEKFGWRVAQICPNAIRILDTEDLHFLRALRTAQFKNKSNSNPDNWQFKDCFREIASIYRCDLSLVISNAEMHLLTHTFGINPSLLFYLPLLYNSVDMVNVAAFAERKDFMFIGNFLHEPNMQTVVALKEKIWPILKNKLPGVQLHIYGAYPSQKALGLHQVKDRFLVHGRVNDVTTVMQSARVLLAPIPFGAGLKGKLLDAMFNGLPSVSSTIGAEGIGNASNWPGFIADDTTHFINDAIQLYTQESSWKQAQENGFECLQTSFQFVNFEPIFQQTIQKLSIELLEHRKQHFMSALLQYHTFQSNKYFSKWIEEKNKQTAQS